MRRPLGTTHHDTRAVSSSIRQALSDMTGGLAGAGQAFNANGNSISGAKSLVLIAQVSPQPPPLGSSLGGGALLDLGGGTPISDLLVSRRSVRHVVTTLAVANALLFAVAAVTAVWSARGAEQPFRALKTVKAILAAVYAVGITTSIWQWSGDEWKTIARWIGVVSIPAVWILPDVFGRRWQSKVAQRVGQTIIEAAGGTVEQ